MNTSLSASPPATAAGVRRGGLRMGSFAGTEVHVDPSLLIIVVLVTGSLGAGLFATWHPDWSAVARWGTALAAALSFLGSILLHELSHAVAARAYGIPVPRITLFLFGGVSEIEREPDTPRAELVIAIVGPLTSFALAALCAAGLALFLDACGPRDTASVVAGLGVVPTLLAWLGPINGLLAVFNLIPGFPLDGGRVLRAALWQATGSLRDAVGGRRGSGGRLAPRWPRRGGARLRPVSGLWLILIGWFLASAARRSNADVVAREILAPLRVRDLMRTRFEVVDADMALEDFVQTRLLRTAQTTWPVTSELGLVGLVSVEQVAAVPEGRRAGLRVGDVSQPIGAALGPDVGGREAARVLAQPDAEVVPVIRGSDLVGLLHRCDVARWLALHEARPA